MQLIGKLFNSLYQWGRDCFFPLECLLCGQGDTLLCPSCFRKIECLRAEECFLCGKKGVADGICDGCKITSQINGVLVAWRYSQPEVKKIIESFKFNFIEELASILSCSLVDCLLRSSLIEDVKDSIVIPIPLARQRYLQRGFNQAELIASELAACLSLNYSSDILTRKKNTQQQAKLNREQRIVNMIEAFECKKNDQIKDKNIFLIDDVFTSGATCMAATEALKKAGAQKVFVLTIAHG